MSALGIIPARWNATRFPGKPLALIAGKPMIQRVLEQVEKAQKLDRIIIATDDKRISEFIDSLCKPNTTAIMTKSEHASGTDRIAEVALNLNHDIIINIQGDEPLIDPLIIDKLIDSLEDNQWDMSTAASPIIDQKDFDNSSVVKVIFDSKNTALYFSRNTIPYAKDPLKYLKDNIYWRHIGIYGYQKKFLFKFINTPQCLLEKLEKLEQLRALHIGCRMRVIQTESIGIGVDTPEDIKKTEKLIKEFSLL